jgi:hypothetical protein
MPRYYFDLIDRTGIALDEEGSDLRDLDAAQNEAARALGRMALDAAPTPAGGEPQGMEIVVRDDVGSVMVVRFSFEIDRKRRS